MIANEFPLKTVPDPQRADPDYLEAMTELMRLTRKAIAPNPLAQAMMPLVPPVKPKKR